LDQLRLSRLEEMARRIFRFSLTPTDEQIAAWVEAFAQSLIGRSARPATWARFYEDLKRVFEAADADLRALSQKAILYDRSGKLLPAGETSQGAVYVRTEASKARRFKGSGDTNLAPTCNILAEESETIPDIIRVNFEDHCDAILRPRAGHSERGWRYPTLKE
jgi:hypothetical protein